MTILTVKRTLPSGFIQRTLRNFLANNDVIVEWRHWTNARENGPTYEKIRKIRFIAFRYDFYIISIPENTSWHGEYNTASAGEQLDILWDENVAFSRGFWPARSRSRCKFQCCKGKCGLCCKFDQVRINLDDHYFYRTLRPDFAHPRPSPEPEVWVSKLK